MSILLIAEQEGEALARASQSALRAASLLQGEVTAVITAEGDKAQKKIVDKLAALKGVKKVLLVKNKRFLHEDAEAFATALVPIAQNFKYIVAAATGYGKNLMPRLAALIDKQQISDITEILAENRFRRPIYAGNAIATLETSDSIIPLTIRATAFEPVEEEDQPATIEEIEITGSAEHSLAEFIGEKISSSERPELTSARIVISGGRGMQASENFQMIEKIADKLKAAVGASRAAVDAGYVTNDYQVGQTGKIVAPELYIAVGISGAIQHLAGMKDSKVIVAINKDPDAPIFRIADYRLVADLFVALPELDKALE